jgi:hypothetical protein
MLIRQMGKIEHSADEALKAARAESAERATELTMTLRDVTRAYRSDGKNEDRLLAIGSSLVAQIPRACSSAAKSTLH